MWRTGAVTELFLVPKYISTVHSTSGGGHTGEVGEDQQPHLLKKQSEVGGATVRRKALHTELLLHRNEELRKVKLFFCFFKFCHSR